MLAYTFRQKIKYIYLEETSSVNTSNSGGHLWPGHQILRDKSSLMWRMSQVRTLAQTLYFVFQSCV